MLRQRFRACSQQYAATTCRGRCCEGSAGILVAVHVSERERVERMGAEVVGGFIVADSRGLCPFKMDTGRCGIHGAEQPFGCRASPFTLNSKDRLIVRNRYRLLRCYQDVGARPAYVSHRWSLRQIFGEAEASIIAARAAAGADIISASMPAYHYEMLHDNDAAKRHRLERR